MATTSEERCNVAELMRGEAADFRKLSEEHDGAWTVDLGDVPAIFQDVTHYAGLDVVVRADAIFNRLADLIDRPTCRNIGDDYMFKCSECGAEFEPVTVNGNEYGEVFYIPLKPLYCSACGAEVMDNE